MKDISRIRRDIDLKVRLIHVLASDIRSALDGLDTKTVDELGLYEYEKPTDLGPCTRYEFFSGMNAMDSLCDYFNDERWAQWELTRDEGERK